MSFCLQRHDCSAQITIKPIYSCCAIDAANSASGHLVVNLQKVEIDLPVDNL